MARRKKKKNTSYLLGLSAALITVVAVVCALSAKMDDLRARDEELARQEAAIMQDVAEAQEEQMALEEERIYVQTKKYIEDMAKEKWGLVKPGEIILKPSE